MSPVLAQNKTNVTVINNGGVSNPKVIVQIYDEETNSSLKKDTMEFKSDKLSFDVDLPHTGYIVVATSDAKPKLIFQNYLFPKTDFIATCEKNNTVYDGSKVYKDIYKAENAIKSYSDKLDVIGDQLDKAGAKRDSVMNALMPEIRKIMKDRRDAAFNYVKANPDDDGSVYLLTYVEDTEAAMALLSNRAKTGIMKPICDAYQKRIDKENARKKQSVNVADGKPAPDFTLKDINGKDLALSSLKGKYVVLDFWGSWCGWCIKGIPDMKKMYAKYQPTGKFQILSIDCNDTDAKWRDAVKKHEMPWLHVYNPKDSKVLATYCITGFPTKIVVDPKGTIVKTIVGEDPAFYEYIDSLFK
jgi:thiol-disulfide isomerase/thioredoxin